eukprot:CAMPEP_0194394740 /NCGR_PEP_ID=MMETSP0174-20130528/124026_1 /TAXON_ID=216777 /ORGANISM="Proboscia alata, Strain PI-D3" /LENGTH=615 /DNA_ID=CAMNT_0039190579 /DNA_START=9 /DNA_END=1856 /DNA_ORIENTATION=+
MLSASNESNEVTEANVGRFIPKIQLLKWHKQMQQRYPQVYPPDDQLFGAKGGNQHTSGTTLKTFFDDDPNKPMKCEVVGSRWNIEFDLKEPMYVIIMENGSEISQIALTSAHEEGGWQVEKVGLEYDDSSADDTSDEKMRCSSCSPPKKGAHVELVGLIKKPELNGRRGVVIKKYDQETGRCGVRLDDDGTAVNAKVSNIRFVNTKQELELALLKLKEAGGTELDPDDDDEGEYTDPEDCLDELLAVGDARFGLEQYDEAGTIYYRSYYITIGKGSFVNNPEIFPIAHKMIQAWSKSNEENYLKMGHGMAQQTLMMPGCPTYIQQDMRTVENAMHRKGITAEDIIDNLRSNMFSITNDRDEEVPPFECVDNVGERRRTESSDIQDIMRSIINDRDEEVPPFECVDNVGERHRIESSASLDTIQNIMRKAGVNDVIELPCGTFGGGAPEETLEITKNLRLQGQGMDQTILKCNLVMKQDGCRGGKVMVQKLKVQGVVTVTDNTFDDVSYVNVEVNAKKSQSDAMTIKCCKRLFLFCCKIIGGSDGLCLIDRSTSARIDQTDIQFAACRGILANVNFAIKNSAVYNCGSYGIKGRVGWTDLGGNTLQPGPWSECGPR